MQPRIIRKWRPPLALVLGGVLGAVLLLPMVGLFLLRDLSPMMGWREAAVTLGIAIVAVTAVLGYVLWRVVLGPVNALVAHADRLTQGDVAPPAPLDRYGTPEMQRLGQAMLDMSDALQSRHSNLQQYSNHVTHELKSPLTTLKGAAEMLSEAKDPQEIAQLGQLVDQSTDRMQQLLEGLRALAAAHNPLEGPDAVLQDLDLSGAGLEVRFDGNAAVPLSQVALQMVFDHMAQNAKEHGATAIELTAHTDALIIRDNGAGITQGNAEKIFEPFFTTKRATGGTGMGLAIVAGLVEARGGKITLDPSAKGAAFRISF